MTSPRYLPLHKLLLGAVSLGLLGSLASFGAAGCTGSTADCQSPKPISDSDVATGFVRCENEGVDLAQDATCAPDPPKCAGTEGNLTCRKDADCKGGESCASYTGDHGSTGCYCHQPSECFTDADCSGGQACLCGAAEDAFFGIGSSPNASHRCVRATCHRNADCGGGECGLSFVSDGCNGKFLLSCRSDDDTCRHDGECSDAGQMGGSCGPASPGGAFVCNPEDCAIGRPLLVDGVARTAAPRARGDWNGARIDVDVAVLDAELRAALAEHWTAVARLEHASVASFARFTLQLLAVGAPPELVRAAQDAGSDEVAHAEIAFRLATAYGGSPVGPGALDLAGVALSTDPREVIRGLVDEACVGETVGVAEALDLGERVEDPALRAVHRRIAADESRHAALAWATLRWLLDRGDASLRRFALEALDGAIVEMAARVAAEPMRVAPAHGLLAAADVRALRAQALAEVIVPLRDTLAAELIRAAA